MRRVLTALLIATSLQAAWQPMALAQTQGDPYSLPLNDKTLTPQEIALQRYKERRIRVQIEGESWSIIQGINLTVPDEELLQLAGQSHQMHDQKQKDLVGSVITMAGGLAGIFGVLVLAQVIPMDDSLRLGVGIGTLGVGIATAAVGQFFFPVMAPSDHFLSLDDARNDAAIVNARLKADLGLPLDMPD